MTCHEMRNALTNFKACAAEAPEGCYEEAKALNALIGEACDNLMLELRAIGLKASANDLAFDLEAAMYGYARRSNPDATVFPTAEGFGSSMAGAARDRVLAQAARSMDFLRSLQGHGVGAHS